MELTLSRKMLHCNFYLTRGVAANDKLTHIVNLIVTQVTPSHLVTHRQSSDYRQIKDLQLYL